MKREVTDNTAQSAKKAEFSPIRRVDMERYITPLREGGSLPALAEGDDSFRYVVKFGGGGHGAKALIAEYLGGMIVAACGLRMPELVFADVSEEFGRTEPDEEVRQLLAASTGLNLGLHYLNGAYSWDVAVDRTDARQASAIVWADAFMTNVDRSFRNTNMLVWDNRLWLIDHGSSFIFHHSWTGWEKAALAPFVYVKDHALLPQASRLLEADALMHERLSDEFFAQLVNSLPEQWLKAASPVVTPQEQREVYLNFLKTRFANSQIFTSHAIEARKTLV